MNETQPARLDGARHVSEELSPERCWELLRSEETGRVGFVHHGRVMILPVHYLVRDHAIYFRTAPSGFIGEPSARLQTSLQVDHLMAGPERRLVGTGQRAVLPRPGRRNHQGAVGQSDARTLGRW